MPYSTMKLDIDDGLARLTFTEAARGNPLDGAFNSDLCEAAVQMSENSGVRCVLIAAEGKTFSVGGDIHAFKEHLEDLPLLIKRWTTTLHSAISRLQRMDAPVVTVVHGVCAGGMSAFVAGSDLVIAGEEAKFAAAYPGIGFSCDAGSSVMYSRRMGLGRARKFLLLNETLTASAAFSAGLVDEVVATDQLPARALAVAQQLAAGPTLAYGAIRRLMLSAVDQPLETQLELEAAALARCAASADAREGVTAFTERRKPVFKGA